MHPRWARGCGAVVGDPRQVILRRRRSCGSRRRSRVLNVMFTSPELARLFCRNVLLYVWLVWSRIGWSFGARFGFGVLPTPACHRRRAEDFSAAAGASQRRPSGFTTAFVVKLIHVLLFLNFVERLDEAYPNGELEVDSQADPGSSAPHSQALDAFGMPAIGERRYYRRSSTEGWEVLLLRRVQGARWVVLLPDQGMRPLMINHRRTVATSPVISVRHMPLPVLSDEQKKVFYDGAAEMIQQNRVGIDMPLYVAGASVHRALAAQLLFGMLGLPGHLRAGARWALRSRSRSIAMVIMIFLFYEGLDILGIFRTFHEWGAACLESFMALRQWLSEINETTLEWVEFMERVYVSATSLMPLRRWLLVFMALALFFWSWLDRGSWVRDLVCHGVRGFWGSGPHLWWWSREVGAYRGSLRRHQLGL